MTITASKINWFLLFKLPAAWFCGVRAKTISDDKCEVAVNSRWINRNPFGSMYFAVQMMAAELATGALLLSKIRQSGKSVSMLVASNDAVYRKRVTGRVHFICNDGQLVSDTINAMADPTLGHTLVLKSVGRDADGEIVSEMTFQWTLKLR